MKERSIIFSTEMVRAILDGKKTQTRRVIKPQPVTKDEKYQDPPEIISDGTLYYSSLYLNIKCPYGKVGDRLWVRETFQPILAKGIEIYDYEKYDYKTGKGYEINYVATNGAIEWIDGDDNISQKCFPSIHMPKWATRIWLEITNIRVERVQDISEEDAKAEGVEPEKVRCRDLAGIVYGGNQWRDFWLYKAGFKTLWDSLNAKRGYSWESNPWVWVIEFKVIKK
ncbi:MAG: hypothetical protein ACYSSI_00280 [Planctomycetota bacterium]|jgi:hypothetical protein